MSTPLPPVRRIVTGIDANGRSFIAEDGVSPAMLTLAARPDYRNRGRASTCGRDQPRRRGSGRARRRQSRGRGYGWPLGQARFGGPTATHFAAGRGCTGRR